MCVWSGLVRVCACGDGGVCWRGHNCESGLCEGVLV